MTNLAGHDLPSLIEAFGKIDHERPICFICYTIKGFGLPFAGHKDNHAGLMTPAQAESLRAAMNIRPGHEWDKFEGLGIAPSELQQVLERMPFAAGTRRHQAARIEVPADLPVTIQPVMSTQAGFAALPNQPRPRAGPPPAPILPPPPAVPRPTKRRARGHPRWRVSRRGL